jgi:hydrogenase nickel incorporation protein HypA/HybF
MNEIALAMTLVELACAELPHFGAGARITDMRIRLGQRSGVVPETLLFSFVLAAEGSPVEGARLDIEDEPLDRRCRSCKAVVVAGESAAACHACGVPEPVSGGVEGLQLVAMSVAGPVARIAAGN